MMGPPRPKSPKTGRKAKWRTRAEAKRRRPAVVIIGFGRLGGALALGLKRSGWPVSVLPRSDASVRRAAELGLRLAEHEALSAAELCVLAVPDKVVASLARELLPDLGPETALVHCAGALDLTVFGERGPHPSGSFHPLCAISDPEDSIAGHAVALAASTPALLASLRRMAVDLGLSAIEVPEARRAAYHAGAVLSAGGVVALAASAVGALVEGGVEEEQALAALLPLMKSAIRGMEQRGLAKGLTGPIPRGDVEVVRAHLRALPEELAALYRLLSLRALALAGSRLTAETRQALAEALAR